MSEVFQYGENEIIINKRNSIKKLYVELSSLCNFTCPMCFRNSTQGVHGSMSEQTLDTLMKQISELSRLKEVLIGGIGEPLLHAGVTEFIKYLTKQKIQVSIQTNGCLLSRELIDLFVDLQIHRIIVSYEPSDIGHREDTNFYNIMQSIIRKKHSKKTNRPFTAVESVLTTDTLFLLPEMAEKCIKIGVDEFILTNLVPIKESFTSKLLYFDDNQQLLEGFLQKARHKAHYQLPYFTLFTERQCRFIDQNTAVIRFDGETAPCYRFLHGGLEYVNNQAQEVLPYSFGNINHRSLYDIWNNRDYLWFRFTVSNSLYPSCLDCQYKEGCDYLKDTASNCWGGSPSCGNCLWSRNIVLCP